MGDVHTPPPSYEAATGIPTTQSVQPNQFFNNNVVAPSAPSSGQITATPHYTPLNNTTSTVPFVASAPQTSSFPSQQIQPPYNPYSPGGYPITRPTLQSNVVLRSHTNKNGKACGVCMGFIILLIFIIVIIVVVSNSGPNRRTTEYPSNTFSGFNDYNRPSQFDWNQWSRDNEDVFKRAQQIIDESNKWNS